MKHSDMSLSKVTEMQILVSARTKRYKQDLIELEESSRTLRLRYLFLKYENLINQITADLNVVIALEDLVDDLRKGYTSLIVKLPIGSKEVVHFLTKDIGNVEGVKRTMTMKFFKWTCHDGGLDVTLDHAMIDVNFDYTTLKNLDTTIRLVKNFHKISVPSERIEYLSILIDSIITETKW